MARYLLVGLQGETTLTLVDLERGISEVVEADAIDASIAKAREAGATVFRGVDVAISIDDRKAAVGRFFFDGGSAG